MIATINFGRTREVKDLPVIKDMRNKKLFLIGSMIVGKGYLGNASNNYILIGDFSFRDKFSPAYTGSEYFGGRSRNNVYFNDAILGYNPYYIQFQILNRNGGIKKSYWFNEDSDNPIKNCKLQLIGYGCGAGSIEWAYLDTPIDHEDEFRFYYDGDLIYRGFIEQDVDISILTATIAPYNQRLKEVLYTHDYSAGTTSVFNILKDMITSTSSITGIAWLDANVDVGTVDNPTNKYVDSIVGSSVEDLITTCSNRIWGIDINNVFFVKEVNVITFNKYLWNTDESIIGDVTVKKDKSKIKATEYIVYKPDFSSETVRVGTVGEPGNITYPPLPLAAYMRRIVGKFEVTEQVTDATALKYAYANLKEEMEEKQTMDIKEIDVINYLPKIGDRVIVEGKWSNSFSTLVSCSSTTGWTNTTLGTSGLKNDSCIKLFNTSNTISYYNLCEIKRYFNVKKIGFFIKSALLGRQLLVGFTDNLSNITYTDIYCRSSNVWEYYDFEFVNNFQYIVFGASTDTQDLFIDDIKLLNLSKNQYVDNIKTIDFDFKGNNKLSVKAACGEILDYQNDDLITMEKEIAKIKRIRDLS